MTRRLTVDDVVRQPLPGMDAPARAQFTRDGRALTYLQGPPDSVVRSLWRHDLASGERTLLADPAVQPTLARDEELRRERQRERGSGITDYQRADDADVLLVVSAGRLFVSHDGQLVVPVPDVQDVQDARLSPDGRHVAFVRSGDIHVVAASGGPARRLTNDAAPGVFNGLAEYIAAEELSRHVGMWWSADGRRLAYAHVDERAIPPYAMQHLGDERLEIEEHRYPLAGGPNARLSLCLTDADGGPSIEVDLGMAPDDYLACVVAHPGGGWLVAFLPRAQNSLHWLCVDPDGTATELWIERSEPWLNLDDDTRLLTDGRILRSTERSGFRHLELREADGAFQQQLTEGDWVVTGVAHVGESRGEVLFLGTRDGVLERHLYAVPLGGGEPQRLTREPGWHEATVSDDGQRWVDTWSSLERAPAVAMRFREGSSSVSIHQPSATAASLDLSAPELREVRAADGSTPLHAALYRPTTSAEPPPAVVWVYGGPHSQKVANQWALTIELHRQLTCQLGFVVVVVDNRGTFFRGVDFEAPLWRQMGAVEVADQAAAVRQLAAEGLLDTSRVGITGGSYGGYLTIMAMLREPELFRSGVAAAPVTDWRLYDTAYTERYLGMPGEEPDAYAESSVLPRAGALRGALLLVHGLIDENVHFQHTARLLSALADADRDAELLVFPDERHLTRRQAARRQHQRRALSHLCRTLGQPLPSEVLGAAPDASERSPQAAS